MRLWVTLDKIDGTTEQKGPLHPDELDTYGMLMYLNRADVAGVTFTRHNPIDRIIKAQKERKP